MHSDSEQMEARRTFLKKCGKFAVATPPAMALLLSTTQQSFATASSGGYPGHQKGHKGYHKKPRRRPRRSS